MRTKFNLAFQQENENTGAVDSNIRIDVYTESLDAESQRYFREGLISLCNGMSDYLIYHIWEDN